MIDLEPYDRESLRTARAILAQSVADVRSKHGRGTSINPLVTHAIKLLDKMIRSRP